jgi:hypothetical protein
MGCFKVKVHSCGNSDTIKNASFGLELFSTCLVLWQYNGSKFLPDIQEYALDFIDHIFCRF